MRNLLIQWVHLSVKGETCERCSDTGKNIAQVLGDLKNDPRFKEVDLEFNEMKLPPEKIGSSNEILLNGTPIEKFIAGATIGESVCRSCSDLLGEPVNCRTICCGKETMESIPKEVIREAILNWLEGDKNQDISECCPCGGDCGCL
ncbi:MAG: DUF2703 domain-containing protein [Candidatus Paceibacterota bacterium]|jgi:hypothetical protein